MTRISANDVSLFFPIYDHRRRSLRLSLMKRRLGGAIQLDPHNHMSVRGLKNVSFTLEPGDRVALIGPNGAGKSVLLRTLAGIYQPTFGRVTAEGTINTLFDVSFGFDHDLTGRQNLRRRCYIMGLRRREIDEMVESVSDYSELGPYLDMPMRAYSAGMALRLAFTISTSIQRDILLMDEWIGVGDASFVHKAQERLLNLTKSSHIVVLASHSEELLRNICNKAVLLFAGELVSFGPLDDVLKDYHEKIAG